MRAAGGEAAVPVVVSVVMSVVGVNERRGVGEAISDQPSANLLLSTTKLARVRL